MLVTVGRIGRPHGIRGDVVVGVRTDEPELRFAPGSRLGTDPVPVVAALEADQQLTGVPPADRDGKRANANGIGVQPQALLEPKFRLVGPDTDHHIATYPVRATDTTHGYLQVVTLPRVPAPPVGTMAVFAIGRTPGGTGGRPPGR